MKSHYTGLEKQTVTKKRNKKSILNASEFNVTPKISTPEEAIERRMKSLNYKLFGLFNPVPYVYKSSRPVNIPFELFTYSYVVRYGNKTNGGLGKWDKKGNVTMVFDLHEPFAYHFDDKTDKLTLKTIGKDEIDDEFLPDQCTREEAERRCTDSVKTNILRRIYHRVGDIELISNIRFYRPALELVVEAGGKEFIKHVYLDSYEMGGEHLSGLRTRMG